MRLRLSVFGMAKQKTTKWRSSRRKKYGNGAADRGRGATYYFDVLEALHLVGRQRYAKWPFALEISAGYFALASDHRRCA